MPGQIRTHWVKAEKPQPPLQRLYGVLAFVAEDLTVARGRLVTRDDIILHHADKDFKQLFSGWAQRAVALFNAATRNPRELITVEKVKTPLRKGKDFLQNYQSKLRGHELPEDEKLLVEAARRDPRIYQLAVMCVSSQQTASASKEEEGGDAASSHCAESSADPEQQQLSAVAPIDPAGRGGQEEKAELEAALKASLLQRQQQHQQGEDAEALNPEQQASSSAVRDDQEEDREAPEVTEEEEGGTQCGSSQATAETPPEPEPVQQQEEKEEEGATPAETPPELEPVQQQQEKEEEGATPAETPPEPEPVQQQQEEEGATPAEHDLQTPPELEPVQQQEEKEEEGATPAEAEEKGQQQHLRHLQEEETRTQPMHGSNPEQVAAEEPSAPFPVAEGSRPAEAASEQKGGSEEVAASSGSKHPLPSGSPSSSSTKAKLEEAEWKNSEYQERIAVPELNEKSTVVEGITELKDILTRTQHVTSNSVQESLTRIGDSLTELTEMRSEVIDLRKQRDALVETNSQLERNLVIARWDLDDKDADIAEMVKKHEDKRESTDRLWKNNVMGYEQRVEHAYERERAAIEAKNRAERSERDALEKLKDLQARSTQRTLINLLAENQENQEHQLDDLLPHLEEAKAITLEAEKKMKHAEEIKRRNRAAKKELKAANEKLTETEALQKELRESLKTAEKQCAHKDGENMALKAMLAERDAEVQQYRQEEESRRTRMPRRCDPEENQ